MQSISRLIDNHPGEISSRFLQTYLDWGAPKSCVAGLRVRASIALCLTGQGAPMTNSWVLTHR